MLFKIVGDFLDKSILKPNNINFPSSRIEFGKLIKNLNLFYLQNKLL